VTPYRVTELSRNATADHRPDPRPSSPPAVADPAGSARGVAHGPTHGTTPGLRDRLSQVLAAHRLGTDGWCVGCAQDGILRFHPCPSASWAGTLSGRGVER
jgi:hypothetical protein